MLGLVIREMGVLENWHVVPSKCYFPFGEVEGRGDKNLPGMRRWAERGRFRNVSQIKWLWSKFLENTSVLPVEYKGKLWRQGKYLKMWEAPSAKNTVGLLHWGHGGQEAAKVSWGEVIYTVKFLFSTQIQPDEILLRRDLREWKQFGDSIYHKG